MRPGIPALACLLAAACAPRKPRPPLSDYDPAAADTCEVTVRLDAMVEDSARPDSVLQVRRGSFGCFGELGVVDRVKWEMCRQGYRFANVYNIQQPGFFSGPCFLADVDLYREEVEHQEAPGPVRRYDTIYNDGAEIYAHLGFGGVLSGNQVETGLDPQPAVEKFHLGLSAEYFWRRLGLEADWDFLGSATAVKDQYQDMALYNSNVYRLGLATTLIYKMTLLSLFKLDLSAGGNYTTLSLDNEYVTFMNDSSVTTGEGSGFGYYAKLKLKTVTRFGFTTYMGAKYEHEIPKFKLANAPLDGHVLKFLFALGYKF